MNLIVFKIKFSSVRKDNNILKNIDILDIFYFQVNEEKMIILLVSFGEINGSDSFR